MIKNKILLLSFVATAAFAAGCTSKSEDVAVEQTIPQEVVDAPVDKAALQDTIKGSVPSIAAGAIGDANIKINYTAPGVKNRIIWGGLVPYDKVWSTGAHMATSVEFDQDLIINNQTVPAGKYAFFTIPGRDEWIVILNKNWEQHLADKYDQKEDVIRMQVKPTLQNEHQERLKYDVKQSSGDEGAITVAWDDLLLTVPVQVKQ